MRFSLLSTMVLVLVLAWTLAAPAITCKECREMENQKLKLQEELEMKEQRLKSAYEAKQVREVTELRTRIVELKRQLLDLRKEDAVCREACRPDVVKEADCNDIRAEILKLEESSDAGGDVAAVDKLYKDLARCNEDLRRIKPTR
ncbi:MAG: hypothetical protein HY914_14135 [Desulfomonile tiedjei]|nr:hypothetical protein [Desulfomonile tiedjei]